jgi:glucose-6-phosphate isomerase
MMGIVASYLAEIDYKEFLRGFLGGREKLETEKDLTALERGITRYTLFSQGKYLENLSTNVKKILPTLKWSKQLWAESNGKEYKSMFISIGFYPEDAHSVGQIWKEGPRKITETYYILEKNTDLTFSNDLSISGMKIKPNSLATVNNDFIEAIIEDRFECGIPVMVNRMEEFSLKEWGELVFNEMVGVVMEAYLHGVNPFNQPGVESYKAKVKSRLL